MIDHLPARGCRTIFPAELRARGLPDEGFPWPAVRKVLMPTSEAEAVELFGDGVNVTVIGGGTIVVPSIAAGRLAPPRTMFLGKAGLHGISRNGTTVTIGAMTSVAALADLAAPLGPCSENVADPEVRAQATLGGNLCASATSEMPRG